MRELNGGKANSPVAISNEHRFAFAQATPRKEAVVGGSKQDGQCRRRPIQAIRHEPGSGGLDGAHGGVGAAQVEADNPLPNEPVMSFRADGDHLPCRCIPQDVSWRQRRRGRSVDEVTTFGGNGFDPDQHAIGWTGRICNIPVVQTGGSPAVS